MGNDSRKIVLRNRTGGFRIDGQALRKCACRPVAVSVWSYRGGARLCHRCERERRGAAVAGRMNSQRSGKGASGRMTGSGGR